MFKASLAVLSLACLQTASAQIPISTSTAYTQNFDGIGATATATLPANFKVDKLATVRTPGAYATALLATSLAGGGALSGTATNGIYNFGAGATTTGSDRAVGFLSSGSATVSGNLYAQFANNTGAGITGLQLSYNVEKYRTGTNPAGFRIQLYYSTDGSTWTPAGANFLTNFAFDATTAGYPSAPGATTAVTNQTLPVAIPNGSNLYLAWNYSVSSGTTTTSAQALAIDDISVLGLNTGNPSGSGAATPNSVPATFSTLLTVAAAAGNNPVSSVKADLTAIGGSASQSFFDDATHGDATPGDKTFSFSATVAAGTSNGAKSLTATVTDTLGLTAAVPISLTIAPPAAISASGAATPNALQSGASTLLTVNVAYATFPASTGVTVTADLTSIGGSAVQQFFDDGTNGDATAGDHLFSFLIAIPSGATPGSYPLTASIADAQSRTAAASLSLSVQIPPPHTMKISQIYGGGGNSGATYTNDFVELYNQSASSVDISGWSLQPTSAGAASWTVIRLCPINSTCSVAPGHYYLVQLAAGTAGTTALPTADTIPAPAVNLGAASGKMALVASTTVLPSVACPTANGIVDFVGYGGTGTNCSETTPVGSLSNTAAAVRKSNGCVDTDNNVNDFIIVGPIPRNSAAPVNTCGGNSSVPSGVGTASPPSLQPTNITLLTVAVAPATSPASTGLTVVADLTAIGGSATQTFYDDGTHGDLTPNDNVFSYRFTIGPAIVTGAKYLPVTIHDTQGRTAPGPITVTVASATCGVERWSIKVGTDADAANVDLIHPARTSINALRSIPVPSATLSLTNRYAPTETTAWVVNGTMTLFKLEADVDYHIVIQDQNGNTMVTEIPSPACDGAASPFDTAITAVRAKFDGRFTADPNFTSVKVPVQMKGVGFFDFIHGQTGVAPNGVELHPVLDILFTTPSTTVATTSLNPAVFGQSVTLTANVSISGSPTPTGGVSFFDGSNLLAVVALDANGRATLTTSALPAGAHIISAAYEGDSSAAESLSAPFTQNITGGSPVSLVPTKTLARVGGQIVATITIANNGGTPAQNVVLTVAKIGATPATTTLPVSLGTIAPGASVQTIVNFPGTAGTPGAPSSLTLSGTYTGGSFGTTARITLP